MSEDKVFDVSGREVNEGDFCLFSTTDNTMNYGMLCGKSYINKAGVLCYLAEIYKLQDDNLNDFEKRQKELIQIAYDKYHDKQKVKPGSEFLKAKDIKIGQAYAMKNHEIYIYYGHGTTIAEFNGKQEISTGYIYLYVGSCNFERDSNYKIRSAYYEKYILGDMFCSSRMSFPQVCKSKKRFITKIDYQSPIFNKEFEYMYRDEFDEERNKMFRPKKNNSISLKFKLD